MVSFARVGVVKAITLHRGVNEFLSTLATFVIRFMAFVKIGIDGGHTFLDGVYRQTVRLSQSEESLEKTCELRHGVHNFSSCYVSCG
jgi:hypothetical protein